MIGDVLTSSILCEELKERYPESSIHYLINSHTQPVVENNPFIDKLILYTPEMEKSRGLKKQLRTSIASEQYDGVIDVYSKIGSARIARASKAPIIAGYKKWYTKRAYTHLFQYHLEPKTEAGVAIENRMKMLEAIAPDVPLARKPTIYLTEDEIAFAKMEFKKHHIAPSTPVFMISVLGSASDKTYPLNYLATLLDHIAQDFDGTLLFNYIPKQLQEVEYLIALCSEKTRSLIKKDLYGKSLRDFMALTSQCTALIGNEGGAINMAKAINVPTFAIFSPWILKKAWALYENEQNVAIHLSDVQPEIYERKSLKAIKNKTTFYYKKLVPEVIIPKLDTFLERVSN